MAMKAGLTVSSWKLSDFFSLKKIIILSDTHGYIDDAVLKHCKNADEVWHAGDIGTLHLYDVLNSASKTLHAVYGNIDGDDVRRMCDENNFFESEKLKILITHIAGSGDSFSLRVKDLIDNYQPDIFVCGHSHILKIKRTNGLLYINPGAAGVYGFHQVRTLVRLNLDEGKITSAEVIELGPRSSSPQPVS
jgi:putative phosphoesterase